MSDYPSLTEMDICCPDEIVNYSLHQNRKDRDVLKISYKRKKGSLLPQRKTFKFGRAAKMVADNEAPNGSREVFEISPFLQKVVSELDSLVNHHNQDVDRVDLLLKRVDDLEEDVHSATAEIRSILKSLKEG